MVPVSIKVITIVVAAARKTESDEKNIYKNVIKFHIAAGQKQSNLGSPIRQATTRVMCIVFLTQANTS